METNWLELNEGSSSYYLKTSFSLAAVYAVLIFHISVSFVVVGGGGGVWWWCVGDFVVVKT